VLEDKELNRSTNEKVKVKQDTEETINIPDG